MIDEEKIKEELERRLAWLTSPERQGHPEVLKRVDGVIEGYKAVLEFIDSLSEESVNEDLHKEVEKAKAIYVNVDNPSLLPMLYAQTGANWQKEQMIKDAINAEIEHPFPTRGVLPRLRVDLEELEYYCSEHGFKHGDKVKVIIIKDE